MGRWEYFALLAGCVAVTVPLEFLYGFRVWRAPRRLARALLPGFVAFTLWDLWAVNRRHWWFSPDHTTGWLAPGGLPVEELAFFLVVPAAAISGYEAVRAGLARHEVGQP